MPKRWSWICALRSVGCSDRILLPWRARMLIRIEHWAFWVNRWAEAKLWGMGLERVSRRSEQPAWRGQLIRRKA